jgi:hypothetical protein
MMMYVVVCLLCLPVVQEPCGGKARWGRWGFLLCLPVVQEPMRSCLSLLAVATGAKPGRLHVLLRRGWAETDAPGEGEEKVAGVVPSRARHGNGHGGRQEVLRGGEAGSGSSPQRQVLLPSPRSRPGILSSPSSFSPQKATVPSPLCPPRALFHLFFCSPWRFRARGRTTGRGSGGG